MSIWFYIFIGYVVFQGFLSLIGTAVVRDELANGQNSFILFRVLKQLFFITISPLWHIIVLITYMKAIITIKKYQELTGIDLFKSRE